MPYIPATDRTKLDAFADGLARNCDNVGELTYALTRLVVAYLPARPSFKDYAECVAALEETKFDLHRSRIFGHESKKERENGPVCDGRCEGCRGCADTTNRGW